MTQAQYEQTRRSFLLDIYENPEDLSPRLIFADWLDEQERPDDSLCGEFIRESIRNDWGEAKFAPQWVSSGLVYPYWEGNEKGPPSKYASAVRRLNFGFPGYLQSWPEWIPKQSILVVHNGFIETVGVASPYWVETGKLTVRNAPVKRVMLGDVRPIQHKVRILELNKDETWWRFTRFADQARRTIPDEIFSKLRNYKTALLDFDPSFLYGTEEDAEKALSDACLLYARG